MRDRHDRHGPPPALLADINVTPFIDVMLVLLIVFMVAAPLMASGVPLTLPKLLVSAPPPPGKPVVVSIDKDGRIFVGRDEVALAQLPGRLADLTRRDAAPPVADPVVYVRGDKALDYGRVLELLSALGAAGLTRLSLLADGQPPPGDAAP